MKSSRSYPGPEDIAQLFDAPVHVSVLSGNAVASELGDAERRLVGENWASSRLRDFTAGRHCARQALSAAGINGWQVLQGDRGAPLWPSGVSGSISHKGIETGVFAVAVVSQRENAIGIDAEHNAPLAPAVARKVVRASEAKALNIDLEHLQPMDRLLSSIVFSAKESIYKCQFPLTGRYLGFQDVELDLDIDRCAFAARAVIGPLAAGIPGRFFGKFVATKELILTTAEMASR